MTRVIWLLATLGLLLAAPMALAADCDVNGDGVVDEADKQDLLSALNSGEGSPAFIADADFDDDGMISLIDLSHFLDNCNE
jgi:hypothetical protein